MAYEYLDVVRMKTDKGMAFMGNIYDNHHNLICEVINTGEGGLNYYTNRDSEGFRELIKNSLEDFGSELDPIDSFVQHLYNTRDYGDVV